MDINDLKRLVLRLWVENNKLKKQIQYDLKTAINKAKKKIK